MFICVFMPASSRSISHLNSGFCSIAMTFLSSTYVHLGNRKKLSSEEHTRTTNHVIRTTYTCTYKAYTCTYMYIHVIYMYVHVYVMYILCRYQ